MLKSERERIERRKRISIGIVLVGILILSTIGYAFYNTEKEDVKKIEYNDVKFVLREDGLWHFNAGGYEFTTAYNPKEVQDISSNIFRSFQDYFGKVLYFSYDSDSEGVNEIMRNLGGFVNRVQYICTEECEEDLPVKDCKENIIVVKEAGENLIRQEESCVYISAKKEDILKASDAFIFEVLRIR